MSNIVSVMSSFLPDVKIPVLRTLATFSPQRRLRAEHAALAMCGETFNRSDPMLLMKAGKAVVCDLTI